MDSKKPNISEKYKFIWLAPQRTGGRKIAEILSYYGFENDGGPTFNFGEYNFSHECDFDNFPDGYKVICNTRNPYSRVLSFFKNFYKTNEPKTKDEFEKFLDMVTGGFMNTMLVNPTLSYKPDYLIRLEHMNEDLKKLPFIYDLLSEKQIDLLTEHHKPIDDWESFYNENTKELIFKLLEHHFIFFGYEK